MVSIRWPFGQAGRARAPEAKESRAGGVIALSGVGRPRWTPNDYASLAREGYQKNAVAYRCIRMIAEAAASAPFAVFVGGARDDDHPLAKLIRRPNPEQSGAELMEAVYGALQVSGNAYVEATGDADGDGAPDELWALRSDRVKVVPGRSGWPEAWDYSVDGRSMRIGRAADGWAPVMHLKLWHPLDDWYGLSPLEAAAQGVDAHNAAGAWNKALLDNAARPSGALVYGARNGERLTDGQTLTVVSRFAGMEEAKAVAAAVRACLEAAALEADGVRTATLRTVFSDVFRAGDGRRTYAVVRLRAVTEETGEDE